jgi:hypothetical protein
VQEGDDLILPDAVAQSRTSDAPLKALLFTGGAEVTVVLLPLVHDRILVGRRGAEEIVDLANFNAEAAANCPGFFITPRSHDREGLFPRPDSPISRIHWRFLDRAMRSRAMPSPIVSCSGLDVVAG